MHTTEGEIYIDEILVVSLVAPNHSAKPAIPIKSSLVFDSVKNLGNYYHSTMDQQILSGFRIGVLSPNSLYEVALATSVGASAVKIYEEANQCNSQTEFEVYLTSEMQRAKDEGETLVVLRRPLRTRWCGFLGQIY